MYSTLGSSRLPVICVDSRSRRSLALLLLAAGFAAALLAVPAPVLVDAAFGALGFGAAVAAAAAKPTTAKPAATAAAAPNKPGQKGNAKDRLDLESTQITGNRELPKVLYIVPWRSAELGDLVGRPVNSLLDEVLEPVDRDVFRRQNRYFEALQPNAAAPAPKPEK